MYFYLFIDCYQKQYLIRTKFRIKNYQQATIIAKQQGLISLHNEIIRVLPLSMIEWFWYSFKDTFQDVFSFKDTFQKAFSFA